MQRLKGLFTYYEFGVGVVVQCFEFKEN